MQANAVRYRASQLGHYESFFLRANHPSRPLALWVRYTMFHAKGSDKAEGELWGMWFNGETNHIETAYNALPLEQCRFEDGHISIGDGRLTSGALSGQVGALGWQLTYTDSKPIFLFPESYYDKALPKAKQLTPSPQARFSGTLTVGAERHELRDWPGCQSHNWGPKHTDLYAWGQVSGFDDAPDAYLECASAKLKMGVWLPMLTPLVLRMDGRDHLLNTPGLLLKNRGTFDNYHWEFHAHGDGIRVDGKMSAPREHFARLDYRNPPGGVKICLNTKIARCELTVERVGMPTRQLVSTSRAAFEILGDSALLAKRGF